MKIIKRLIVVAALVTAAVYAWLVVTTVSASELPPLQNGDLIFQTSGSGQSLAILAASHSPYTHMGIIEQNSDGSFSVVEAVGPVKSTPLQSWINRGKGKRITIKRMESLSAEDKTKILATAHRYDGRPYDLFFLNGTDAIYCSELISLTFAEGIGLGIGKVQKVKDLNIDNFISRNLIEKRWRKHPLCADGTNSDFESCYAKILEQELVTPASIAADARLKPVYSNYGILVD